MKKLLLASICTLLSGAAASQQADPAVALGAHCASSDQQTECLASCAPLCQDRQFFVANAQFCAANGFDQSIPADLTDTAACSISVDTPQTPEDCSGLPLTQRLACEEAPLRPKCAENVPELISRANAIVLTIDQELQKYGELLTENFDVEDRDALCVFSRTELDNYYAQAAGNPQALDALQAEAVGIQNCQKDYENYISPVPISGTTQSGVAGGAARDILSDQVVRAIRTDLDRMKPEMQRLTTSIETFASAAKTIEGIARIHISVCAPGGTPIPTP